MRQTRPFLFPLVVVLALLHVAAGRADDKPFSLEQLAERTIPSTVWVFEKGKTKGYGATGFVVDRTRGWVITNKHVTREAQAFDLWFPAFAPSGDLIGERSYYRKLMNLKAPDKDASAAAFFTFNSDRMVAEQLHREARVIATDSLHDLALLELTAPVPAHAARPGLRFAREAPRPGERIFLVGHPADQRKAWVFKSGTVLEISQRKNVMSNGQAIDAMSIQGTIPAFGGDSGSPVVNERGELVGVHHAGVSGHSLAVDLRYVRALLANARSESRPTQASPGGGGITK
jgi:S1-C subfamily serine protease